MDHAKRSRDLVLLSVACGALGLLVGALVGVSRRRVRSAPPAPSDPVTRGVIKALAHVASDPHSIRVGGSRGRIVLRGRVPAAEKEELLFAVWSVDGVREVDDRLTLGSAHGGRRRFVGHRRRLRGAGS